MTVIEKMYISSRGGGGESDVTCVEGVDRMKGGRMGWAMGMHPHPQQAGPKMPSSLNISEKVSSYMYSLVCVTDQ
jgi:hypothetical protein